MLDRPTMPPADLGTRRLPLEEIPMGSVLFRVHQTKFGAKFFGRSASFRFDSPGRTFGTLYAAPSAEIAFAETLLRGQNPLVAESELRVRSLCEFTMLRPVRLVRLHGSPMITIGASAAVSAGGYDVSQAWAQALHDHADKPDGILHRSTRDNDRVALVLFDRSEAALDVGRTAPILADSVRLGRILDYYGASLI
jgi:RES domain